MEGTTFSFIADFTVVLGAQARYDVGMYFATDGDPNEDGALTGVCAANIITPKNTTTGLGSNRFVNLDTTGGDTCGDIDASHTPQIITVRVDNASCVDTDGDQLLNLPNCTSWRQPGSNEICNSEDDAFPGSPSKCNCDLDFQLPIRVRPQGAVTKAFNALLCADVRYDVTVNNTGSAAVTLTSLTDDGFGSITSVHDDVLATTCAAGGSIAAGGSYACTFDAKFCSGSHTNEITAVLTDGFGQSVSPTSGPVAVTVTAQQEP